MRKLAISCCVAVVSALMLTGTATAAEDLKADLDKCKITFVGSKPDGTKHEGGFKKFEIDAKADWEEAEKSSINIEIKTESLFSDNDKLTAHLKNPDFFDVRKYPKATFKSTKIEPKGEDPKATITGKLKMLDKEVEVKIPVELEVGEDQLKMAGKFKIDRTKWGMDYGKGKINDEVELAIEFVFKR